MTASAVDCWRFRGPESAGALRTFIAELTAAHRQFAVSFNGNSVIIASPRVKQHAPSDEPTKAVA